jgi:hypothetical protein
MEVNTPPLDGGLHTPTTHPSPRSSGLCPLALTLPNPENISGIAIPPKSSHARWLSHPASDIPRFSSLASSECCTHSFLARHASTGYRFEDSPPLPPMMPPTTDATWTALTRHLSNLSISSSSGGSSYIGSSVSGGAKCTSFPVRPLSVTH